MSSYSFEKSGDVVTFKVPSTVQPGTYIAGIFLLFAFTRGGPLSTIAMWIGIICAIPVAIEWLLNRRNPPFSVSPASISAKGVTIDRDRINSIDVRNSQAGGASDTFLLEANAPNVAAHAGHSFMKRYYHVVSILHAGGKRTKLAGGLKADTAYSLVADIQRALNGQLR